MKIIGGEFKGRALAWPNRPDVRPITSLLRGTLFEILGPLDGLSFLDAYAGSGSIGFEALSRGAKTADFIELLPAASRIIKKNALDLNVEEKAHIYNEPIEKWLKTGKKSYNLIVAGPPFAHLDTEIMNALGEHLEPKGLLVVWHSSRISPLELESVSYLRTKTHGDSSLSFYRR